MTPELGHFALILALGVALLQSVFGLAGAHRNDANWMRTARTLGAGQFAFALIAFVMLAVAFLQNDFSLMYVAQNSNTALPWPYRIAAVWGAHEGSLLLWILVLAGWTLAVVLRADRLPEDFAARVIGVLGLISVGFLLFTLFTSNPFARLAVPPLDGRDLNPILQDPALAIHPPLLYFGYVGLSVPFAFALAALLGHRPDSGKDVAWARAARPWTAVAWLFLTVGIALGSWWAYYELGWGGWWFWDPVENASFMPWLIGTALIHSLAVTEKRGAFMSWTILLAIAAFSLSLLGTFLVRSGVLVSVHAFASDPTRGVFILAFLAIVVGGALTVYAIRAPHLPPGGGFKPWSRETLLLTNNVLLTVAAGAVLLGTLYPLFLDTLGLGKISVGPPYFNAVFAPLMMLLLAAIAFGPLVNWKRDNWQENVRSLRVPLIASVVIAVVVAAFTFGNAGVLAIVGIWLALWAILAAFTEPLSRWKRARNGARSVPLSSWGMSLAHLGLGITALGIVVVSAFGFERDVAMTPGEPVEYAGYTWELESLRDIEGSNFNGEEARISVSQDGELVTVLFPQKRMYTTQRAAMTEAGIDAGVSRDLYASLGEPLGGNAWSVRLQVKPLVRFIWLGALLMALGVGIAAFDRRYRKPLKDAAREPLKAKTATAGENA
ncbi:MAG TPA: heme lyase CcmF/NrfE family subunit [Gammaproteobacteria bacterium]